MAGRFEGSDDGGSGTASYEGSPVQLGNYYHSHSGTQHHSLHPLHPSDPNPYFGHVPVLRAIGGSPAESPLERTGSSTPSQIGAHPARPQTMAGNLAPLAGTSPNEYLYQQSHDRFPFSGPETYAAAAIRG
jgi:hypothetical protein